MGRFTKPIGVFLVVIVFFAGGAVLWKRPSWQEPSRSAPAKRRISGLAIAPSLIVRPIPNRKTAVREALHCLNALCDSGASDNAITETQALVAHLNDTLYPFASSLSVVLKSILSYLDGGGNNKPMAVMTAARSGYPDISSTLIDRAAAACEEKARRKPDEIVLSFAGDCTFGTVNGDNGANRFPSVYRRSGRVDYPFALLKPWLLNDDLTVVNFECTLTNAIQTADKQWKFKGAARYASIFPAGSIEAVGLSNNHSFDYLQAGFNDTVANFRMAGVPLFYQNTPYVTMLRGVQVIIIGDCTVIGENKTRIDGTPERVLSEIQRYKRPDNIVIVVMHWGSELATVPFLWQQKLGRKFIDAGADAVVGHHPHVVQGIELYRGKYIAYSLGNFAFGGNSLARHPETFVLRLRFHVRSGITSVKEASIVPCLITSSHVKNNAGILTNNYQPKPVFGETAARAVKLVLDRSAVLKYGVKRIGYFSLP